MKTIINKLRNNKNFIDALKNAISEKMIGKHSSFVDYSDDQVHGYVGYYEVVSDLDFEEYNFEDNTLLLHLIFIGEASINYKKYHSPDGELDDEKTLQRSGTAYVRVTFLGKESKIKNIDEIDEIDKIIESLNIEVINISSSVLSMPDSC